MKITDKTLDDFVFCFGLSSGPDVLVCFGDDEFYVQFSRKRNESDIEIFRYKTIQDLRTDKKILKEKVRNSINEFIINFRDKKIDDILD